MVDDNPNLNYLFFLINNRDNFCYDKDTSYLMHLIFLSVVKSQQNMLSVFSKIFNVDKLVSKSMNENINLHLKYGVGFFPDEIIKDDKTFGWITNDFANLSRVITWLCKYMDLFL